MFYEFNVLIDKWLILRFRYGSQEAFCRIFEAYKDTMLRLALSLLFDRSVAEDIVHEVFLQMIRKRQTFELTGSLKAYLSTCVANRVRNANRDLKQTETLDSQQILQKISDSRRPDQWAVCSEEFEQLREALLQLPCDQREVVILHTQGHLTFKQISKYQDCSFKTVQSRYRYALNKLRVLLDGQVAL